MNRAIPLAQVTLVDQPCTLQMIFDRGDDGFREQRDAIFGAFPIAHGQVALIKIDVFDAQAHAFRDAQPAAVEQLCHDVVSALDAGQQERDFFFGKHGRHTFGATGAHRGEREVDGEVEYLAVEEEQGVERLVLGGGGDLLFDGQMGEEGFDLCLAHVNRVAFTMGRG